MTDGRFAKADAIENTISGVKFCESQRLVVVIVRLDGFNSPHCPGTNLLIDTIVARKVDNRFPIIFYIYAARRALVDNIGVSA